MDQKPSKTNKQNNDDNAHELLSLFLYTMQSYERITSYLPISEGLRSFNGTNATLESALAHFESDCAAIDVRLMLQRKYFSDAEPIQLRKLRQALESIGILETHEPDHFDNQLDELRESTVELGLSNGITISGQFKNLLDATYGTLLHADIDRAMRLVSTPENMRLIAISPFVIKREKLLLSFKDLCEKSGITALYCTEAQSAPVLRWTEASKDECSIMRSPFWANMIGHDADYEDLNEIADNNSIDDNFVILLAWHFFELLKTEPLDIERLEELVWEEFWEEWSNFEQAAEIFNSLESPGVSTTVGHAGGDNYAQIKILTHVNEPFVVTKPQLIPCPHILICLTKRANIWKINGMGVSLS